MPFKICTCFHFASFVTRYLMDLFVDFSKKLIMYDHNKYNQTQTGAYFLRCVVCCMLRNDNTPILESFCLILTKIWGFCTVIYSKVLWKRKRDWISLNHRRNWWNYNRQNLPTIIIPYIPHNMHAVALCHIISFGGIHSTYLIIFGILATKYNSKCGNGMMAYVPVEESWAPIQYKDDILLL